MLQVLIRYILNGFHKACNSFNLFFYRFNDKIICKAIPRFVVSPLFVGYKIPQVLMDKDLNRMTKDLSALYSAYARSEILSLLARLILISPKGLSASYPPYVLLKA